jgi:hypothetical protein
MGEVRVAGCLGIYDFHGEDLVSSNEVRCACGPTIRPNTFND